MTSDETKHNSLTDLEEVETEIETAIGESLREFDDIYKGVEQPTRVYLISTLALSVVAWDLAFNYGVYDTVFFGRLFFVWVACTSILLAITLLPPQKRFLNRTTVGALLVPSVWLATVAFLPGNHESELADFWISLVELATLFSLPYLGFALLFLTQPDTFTLSTRMRIGMAIIILFIALVGYLIGSNHPYFLTCNNFDISGNFVPTNCVTEQL